MFSFSGFFPPTSAAAYLGSQAASLGSKMPQPPPPHHLAAMYPNFPGLGGQGLGNPGMGPQGLPGSLGQPRLDLGGNPPGP
jgi:hypothetical protein